MRQQTWSFILGLLLLLWAENALAFKQKGHTSVERAAYEALLESEAGVLAVQRLIASGILRPPVSLDTPDAYQGLRLLSDVPDNSMERQLQSYGQCFHFMARSADVTESNGTIGGMPERMVADAYLRCMGLVDTLFRSILYDPVDSRERKLDVYVLMHIISDTFSEAHVIREFSSEESYKDCKDKQRNGYPNCSGKIAYLNSWRLRSAIPYVVHPSAWKFYFNESHHGILEPRDEDYLDKSKRDCLMEPNPNFVTTRCLTDAGLRARDALVSALQILANYVQCTRQPTEAGQKDAARAGAADAMRTCTGLDKALSDFYATYLSHVLEGQKLQDGTKLVVNIENSAHLRNHSGDVLVPPAQIELEPLRDLGAGLSLDLSADEPLWLTGRLFGERNSMDSEVFGLPDLSMMTFEFRLPLEDASGRRQLGAAFEYGLKMPMDVFTSRNYGLLISAHARVEYTVSPIADSLVRHRLAVGFGGAALDFTVLNLLWFGAEGPRCMFVYDSWLTSWNNRTCYWGVKAGGTFGVF